jgi:Tol biopolymer transport system component
MRRDLGSNRRSGRRKVGLIGSAVLVAGLAAGPGMLTAKSATPVGVIERVSVVDGAARAERNSRPDGGSSLACSALTARRCTKRTLSDDGTKVVYASAADNLVDGDTNGRMDVFLTTISPGKPPTPPSAGSGGSPADPGVAPSVVSTVRVSAGPGGEGDGDSTGASISPDGHWIAFESSASNLVPGDGNGKVDVFVYHVDDQSLRLASVPASGGSADGDSFSASVANNGTVSFTSTAGNLVGGASGQQVYARSDKTELVSSGTGGAAGDGQSGESTISGDGTTVAFTSNSTNLGSGHAKGDDIFIHKVGGATTMLTSGSKAYLPSISADGQRVIFIAEGFDNDTLPDIYQSSTQGGSPPTIYAQCPCRSGGDVGPTWATIGSGGAILYSSAAPFSRSNRYLDAQVFEHNPGQAIVSVASDVVANAPAEFPSVSADGALVAFESAADNLTEGDTNGASDVFLAQMGDAGSGVESRRMLRVSVYATGDARRTAASFSPAPTAPASVSADGNLVAFASDSSNLVPGDTNGVSDIFIRNRGTGKTERVSVPGGGGQADGASVSPAMSADGRFVVFASEAANLAPGDTNGVMDIYVRDRARNETRRLSEKPGTGQSPVSAQHPSISPNGRWVAFDSAGEFAATPQSGSGRTNVFRFNMESGNIDMVSTMIPEAAGSPRRAGYKASWAPSVADDGSVAFLSDQTAMTANNGDDPVGAIPNYTDVFVGRPDGTVIKASMNADPQQVAAVGDSYEPRISADGTKVVFVVGGKSNMPKTSADQNPDTDVYLRDLSGNTTIQINQPGGGDNRRPAVNGDGSVVAFVSDASNLVGGDGNGTYDVFVAKVAGGGVTLSRLGPAAGDPNGPSYMPALSVDGHTVVFASRANNLVDGDGNGAYDWFARADADVPCVTCNGNGLDPNAPGFNIGTGTGDLVTGSGPGYRFVAADGGIFSFGPPFAGSAGGKKLAKPIVGMAATPSNNGYWLVASDGGIFSYGDAAFYGSTGALKLAQPIVGMTASPSGKGYWFVASDGGIFAFGDAKFFGSMGGKKLNKPIVGMASTASGQGYWLVASDGGIFSFGDAKFFGSTGNIKLAQPIVGMDRTASGQGYRFVASDGGIFSFGDAKFFGSMGGKKLAKPIVGMASTRAGDGYWLVASDGGIFSFGNAGFRGSTGALKLASPIVGMAS